MVLLDIKSRTFFIYTKEIFNMAGNYFTGGPSNSLPWDLQPKNSLTALNDLSNEQKLSSINKATPINRFDTSKQLLKSAADTVKNKFGKVFKGALDSSKIANAPLSRASALGGLGPAIAILAESPDFSRHTATTPGMQQTMAENEAYLDAGYFRTDDGELIPLSNPTATPLPAEAGPAILNAREKELFDGQTSPITIHPDHPDYFFEKENGTSTDIGSAPVVTPSNDINTLVKATLRGDYGTGAVRKKALGANYEAVQKAINGMDLPKASGSKTTKSKTKEPSVAENLNKNSGNWMDSLSGLLPLLAIGAGAYYWGKH